MFRERPSSKRDGTENCNAGETENGSQHGYFQVNPLMLEKLIEASPAFIYIFDRKSGCFVYASSNLQQMLGQTSDHLVQGSFQKIFDLIAIADIDNVTKAEASFMEAVANFPAAQRKDMKSIMIFRMTRADGSAAWVQQQKTILETDPSGEPLLVMALITDISVTRKCHEFFSSVVYRDKSNGWRELGAEDARQRLSNREAQILRLLAKGKSSKIIAGELSISVNTVNNHRKNMLLKTGTSNIAELVSYGLSQGLI